MHALTRRLGAAGCAGALLLVSACGGGEDPSGSPAPSTSTSSSAPETSMAPSSSAPAPAGITPTGTGDPFVDAKAAAHHMPMTANVLAQGFAKAANVKGQTGSKAAELRSGLTYMLTEHVYLAGIAVATAYATSPTSPEFTLAAKTLDTNSQDLAKAIGSIAGPANQATFLQAWRAHINDFVAYAVAAKGKDAKGKAEAVKNLDAYRATAGAFFAKITDGVVPATTVEGTLEEHVTTLTKAIDGFAAGLLDRSPERTSMVRVTGGLARAAGFGLTVEPAGGSPQPTTPPIARLSLA